MKLTDIQNKLKELEDAWEQGVGIRHVFRLVFNSDGKGYVENITDKTSLFQAFAFDEEGEIMPKFNREIMRVRGDL